MILIDTQYQERLTRLSQLHVGLDFNLTNVTVPILFEKLATLQKQRERASAALVEALGNRAEAKALYEAAKTEFDMQMDNLLATDDAVKQQKTAELRNSLASTKAANLALAKHHALIDSIHADSYFDRVKEVNDELKNTYDNLSAQIDLMKFSLEIGIIPLESFSTKK